MGVLVDNIGVYEDTVKIAKEFFGGSDKATFHDLKKCFGEYVALDKGFRQENSHKLIDSFKDVLQLIDMCEDDTLFINYFYYVMSFLLKSTGNRNIYLHMIDFALKEKNLTKENKFFLYYRFVQEGFLNPQYDDDVSCQMRDLLYKQVLDAYREELNDELTFIDKDDRNKEFVIVLIGQILDMSHGPTKTLVDRCYILEKVLNKKVFIINTAELLSPYGAVPMFDAVVGSYEDSYLEDDKISYKDTSFSLFQCPREMPQVPIIREILNVVKTEKPYFILTIGGSSIVSDLCSKIVPTLSLATVFSGRTVTHGTFQAMGRNINDNDRLWMKNNNLPDDHIIESLFTFTFREQTHNYTRKDLGLPEEGFIAVLVGGRLDKEVDSDCESMLLKLTENGIKIAIIGIFERYNSLCETNESFKKNAYYLGFQEDVLAIDECCDLYINPKRVGGGTSVAEALYKGLPAVTFDFGDVGVTAGTDFHVADYEDMYNKIIKYSQDKEYYEEMSQRARQRGLRLIDSEGEFLKVIEKMEKSPRF